MLAINATTMEVTKQVKIMIETKRCISRKRRGLSCRHRRYNLRTIRVQQLWSRLKSHQLDLQLWIWKSLDLETLRIAKSSICHRRSAQLWSLKHITKLLKIRQSVLRMQFTWWLKQPALLITMKRQPVSIASNWVKQYSQVRITISSTILSKSKYQSCQQETRAPEWARQAICSNNTIVALPSHLPYRKAMKSTIISTKNLYKKIT